MSYSNNSDRDRPNSGVLFTNDRKQTDRHPDMTGYLVFDTDVIEALIKGHRQNMPMKLQISAWMGRSSRGSDYLSIRFGTRDTPINRGLQQGGAAPQPMQQRNYQQQQPQDIQQRPVMQQPRTLQPPSLAQQAPRGRTMQEMMDQQAKQNIQNQTPILDDEIPF